MAEPGTAPPAEAGCPGAAPAPEPPRTPRWRRPRALIAIGAAVVVAVLAATGQRAAQVRTTDPAAPVEEVLALITDRRGSALATQLGIESLLVTDEALARGYEPPEDLRTAGASYGAADADTRRPDRDTATVAVAYRLGAQEHRTSVRVQRETTGWVREWEVVDATGLAGALTITSTHLEQARVAGADLPTTPPDSRMLNARHPALPGTYTITTPPSHPLFEAAELGAVAVAADDTDRRPATFDVTGLKVRSGLAADVHEQITARLDTCAEQTALAPPGCPLHLDRDSYQSVEDVSWTITAQPQIRLLPADDTALHGAPLTVETTTPGAAEVTYRHTYGADEPKQETVDITVGGGVGIDEDGRAEWEQ
ncbi:hypothetical protein HDA32_005607 [Spinactinospora alkalitolerans]|uniref:Uncharacterized protein n=1 Tax=Spinactinospora alkalitolerans TaxID=687207 RepID=A0A852U4F6_9ACTN|nr:hypothetical protein [Spinactinospora alkalitolerans]NYE50487.1 hypothetical protein [Spinactinospora alkalitolerans]